MANLPWTLRVPLDLEKTCAAELRALGGGVGKTTWDPGVVYFEGPEDAAMRANLHLRTADRVLKPLGAGEAVSFHTLRLRCSELPWENYIPPGSAVNISVSAMGCKLYHTGAVEDAIREGLEGRGLRLVEESEDYPLWVDARGTRDWWTLSIDTSGRGLTRRGYRKATAKAPIRETLAAAVLRAAGYEGSRPLMDPMCGAGTFVIEGSWIASKRAPGMGRKFAFQRFPSFDEDRWGEIVRKADEAERKEGLPRVVGYDKAGGAVRAAKSNALRAGVAGMVDFQRQEIANLAVHEQPGLVVLNPPYGQRLEGEDSVEHRRLIQSYARWGDELRRSAPGWDVALVCPSQELAQAFGFQSRPKLRFRNGGISVGLWVQRGPQRA